MRRERNRKTKLSWKKLKKQNQNKVRKIYLTQDKVRSADQEKELVWTIAKQKHQISKLVIIV